MDVYNTTVSSERDVEAIPEYVGCLDAFQVHTGRTVPAAMCYCRGINQYPNQPSPEEQSDLVDDKLLELVGVRPPWLLYHEFRRDDELPNLDSRLMLAFYSSVGDHFCHVPIQTDAASQMHSVSVYQNQKFTSLRHLGQYVCLRGDPQAEAVSVTISPHVTNSCVPKSTDFLQL